MLKIYIVSDTHFNHENIRHYCPKFRSQYSSVEDMNKGIIEIYNNIVGPEDVTYIIGDLCMGKRDKMIPLINQLQGKIYLSPGNHDKALLKFHKQGLLPTNITILPEIYNLTIDSQTFVLCHYPIDDWEGRAEHSGHEPRTGYRMLHGHLHGNRGAETAPGRWDVGFDVWGKPMPIEYFLAGG